MKLAVIGGTGLIGSQVVKILNAGRQEAVPHSPSTGLDTRTATIGTGHSRSRTM